MTENVMDTPDISEYTNGICAVLGVDPKNVYRIILRPTLASFEVFRLDETGHKYIDSDTHEIALDEMVEFKVKT